MASVGALLDHLVRERAASDYDDAGIPGLNVKDICILSLYAHAHLLGSTALTLVYRNQVMHINMDALL